MRRCYLQTVSRIHIALIDLSLKHKRIDGGAGIALNNPNHYIEITKTAQCTNKARKVGSSCFEINMDVDEKVVRCVERTIEYVGAEDVCLRINILHSYEKHIGLGSITQMCLGISTGIARLLGRDLDPITAAKICSRAGTSGIGLYSFMYGGFIVDGGHRLGLKKTKPLPSDSIVDIDIPPLIARKPIPEKWRFILIRPLKARKIYGKYEEKIFATYTPIPFEEASNVAYHILMGLLPAIISNDIEEFNYNLRAIQDLGFKKVEWSLQDPLVISLRKVLDEHNIAYGLSSMGPTVYIPCTLDELPELENKLNSILDTRKYMTQIAKGSNQGSQIRCS